MIRVTAAGSLPGLDFAGALTAMAEALPNLVPWPELPARGAGSAMVGRALGLITELGFDLQPAGWRLVPGSSAEHRRAQAQWRSDLDDAEERLQGFTGTLKLGLAGPWTLAASVERTTGDRLLSDHGARRELGQGLAEAVIQLREQLRRRLPECQVVLQLDEPALVAVASGTIPTASGFGKHRAVEVPELVSAMRPFAEGAWLHCCAKGPWLPYAQAAGFRTVAVDVRCFREPAALESLGSWVHEGATLAAGVVDTASRRFQPVDEIVHLALKVLRPLELSGQMLPQRVILTSGCGFAGWEPAAVSRQLAALNRAAELTSEALGAA